MKIFGKFFAFLGALLISAEHMTKKIYDNLPAADQQALQNGSGFLAIVNNMLDATPAEIRAAFKASFPTVDEPALEKQVYLLARSYGLTTDGSLDDTIAKLQGFLAKAPKGQVWQSITTGASLGLALLFGGPEAKTEVYLQVLRYVYTNIVKPLVEKKPLMYGV